MEGECKRKRRKKQSKGKKKKKEKRGDKKDELATNRREQLSSNWPGDRDRLCNPLH